MVVYGGCGSEENTCAGIDDLTRTYICIICYRGWGQGAICIWV